MTDQLPPPNQADDVIPPDAWRSSKQVGGNSSAMIECRTKYGLITIPSYATVRIETRRWLRLPILFVGDASRAWVRDKVAYPSWPTGVWATVTKSVRSKA